VQDVPTLDDAHTVIEAIQLQDTATVATTAEG
jgi:hypothetical protein